jgi:hypothetical protein
MDVTEGVCACVKACASRRAAAGGGGVFVPLWGLVGVVGAD